eukprot:m.96112 g.96112  ORF g.96112 m.96112 type:complete len:278 (-) comp26866_c1_seq1:184-1017(-)
MERHPTIPNTKFRNTILVKEGAIGETERILEVNGFNVESASNDVLNKLLKMQGDAAVVLVPTKTLRVVNIIKAESVGLGLKLTTEIDIEHAAQADYWRISEVIAGGPAARTNQVKVGDVINMINGRRVEDLEHNEAISLLSRCSEIELVLEDSHVAFPLSNPIHRGVCLHRRSDGEFPVRLKKIHEDRVIVASIDDSHITNGVSKGDRVILVNGEMAALVDLDSVMKKGDTVILTVTTSTPPPSPPSPSRPSVTITDTERLSRTLNFDKEQSKESIV